MLLQLSCTFNDITESSVFKYCRVHFYDIIVLCLLLYRTFQPQVKNLPDLGRKLNIKKVVKKLKSSSSISAGMAHCTVVYFAEFQTLKLLITLACMKRTLQIAVYIKK